MRNLIAAIATSVLLALSFLPGARAQSPVELYTCVDNATGTNNPGYNCTPVTSGNPLPVSASVSASISGFAPATTGTPITATTGGVTGTLPAGAVVSVFNTGTTNTAYCKLGASATTSDIAIPPSSWFAYTVGAATQLTCITSTSTTTVNMVGGTGLPTGAGGGGGSGGGGGGAITVADGADVTQGAIADVAATAGSTGTVGAKLRLMTTQLGTINTTLGSPLQTNGSLTNISGTISLPTGASTSALQTTGNTSLSTIATNTTNAATTTLQTTGNSSLSTIATNSTAANRGVAATGAAVPANAVYNGFNSSGNLVGVSSANPLPVTAATLDPCQSVAKIPLSGSQTTSTQLFAGTSAKKTYICSALLLSSDTESVSIVGGTGSVCGTGTGKILGETTAVSGFALVANSGFSHGNGMAYVGAGATNADNVCLLQTGTGRVNYSITYVQN